jgi:hypothetical protein
VLACQDGSALERPIVVLWVAYVAGQPVSAVGQLVVALIAQRCSRLVGCVATAHTRHIAHAQQAGHIVLV